MTALSPGRSGPLPGDALLTRGPWQYARYYGLVTSAPKATTPAGVSPARIRGASRGRLAAVLSR